MPAASMGAACGRAGRAIEASTRTACGACLRLRRQAGGTPPLPAPRLGKGVAFEQRRVGGGGRGVCLSSFSKLTRHSTRRPPAIENGF
jgi:hypothetical protein